MSTSPVRVLIVDDLEMNRRVMVRGLERHGFEVREAEGGLAALDMIARQDFDAVLLDVAMPVMSGRETLRHIRARHDANDLPVIMVTAFDDPKEVSMAIEAGANDYLTKPVDMTATVARVKAQAGRKRAISELKAAKTRTEEQVEARTRDLEAINDEMRKEISRRRELETELREAKRRAETANRAKSDFLATMSHELRTPLNSIIGFSELIRIQLGKLPGGDRLDEYAAYINESGNHLLEIVNDILDLSKIDAGRTELNESHIGVSDLLDRSMRMTSGASNGHVIRIEVDASLEKAELFCDEVLMRRALVNLLSNAVKFSEPGSHIDLSAMRTTAGDLSITVADQGIGIEAADIPKVLEPFGQANSELSRSHVGTGLGVPLTKSLIELHDGVFDLQSEVGVGTTVTLTLPAVRMATRPASRSHSAA